MVAELDKKLGDAQEISRAIERLATHGQQAGFGRLVPDGARPATFFFMKRAPSPRPEWISTWCP
jgi:hypothetical protein